jgi:hypothetical protein
MFISMGLGRIVARRLQSTVKEATNAERMIGAFLALAAFLLGFAFSMSVARYELRRTAIITEANAIGTAALRADLYPDSVKQKLRSEFSDYLESRIRFFTAGAQLDSVYYYVDEASNLGMKIWKTAADYSRQYPGHIVPSNQMIPAINEMLDAATSRHAFLEGKVPESVLYLLFGLVLISSFFAGYTQKHERVDILVSIVFSLMTVAVVYLIIDFDRPRRGLVQNDTAHKNIVALRSMFTSTP